MRPERTAEWLRWVGDEAVKRGQHLEIAALIGAGRHVLLRLPDDSSPEVIRHAVRTALDAEVARWGER